MTSILKPTEHKIFAKELGIDLASKREKEYFKWFLACLLFGKPIQQEVAKRAYFEFVKEDLVTPEVIIQAGWDTLVEVLDRSRYRYGSSTATELLDVSKTLQEKYGTLTNLLNQSQTIDEVSSRLQEFKGIGPKTPEIFLRDITPLIDSDIRTSIKASNGENALVFCPSCGAELPGDAHFCRQCGYPLNATVRLDRRTNNAPSSPGVAPLGSSAADSQTSIRSRKVLSKLPMPVERVTAAVLVRARDAQPEVSSASAQEATESQSVSWGWLPALSLTGAVGVFLLALAYNGGRDAAQWADPLFWFGLLVLFLPIAGRLLSLRASRRERIALLVVLGMALYLAKYLQYPLYFTYHDEFAHWRTAYDIAASGHLFQRNPIIPISSFYPGLEIATNALSSLTGLSLFAAGNVVLGVGRLVLILAVYLFFEHIISSARVAGIATLLYMANPHFLLFDADFSYESLALPLAMFVLFAVVSRSSEPGGRHRGLTLAIWLGLGTVVITHHVTSYALVAFLLLWMVVSSFKKGLLFTFRHKIADFHASLYPQRHGAMHQSRDRKDKDQAGPGWAALIGLAMSIAWLIYTGDLAVGYLSPFLSGALHQLAEIFFSRGPIRPLFQDASGFVAPLWERTMTYASIGLILLGLPFGIFWIWRHKRSNALALSLGVVAFAYPVSQMFRLTKAGAESADRATAFLFLSLAFVLAIGITGFWLPRALTWRRSALVMGAIAIIFLGQVIAGSGPMWFRMPGPYLVIADPRSIEPEGISAAKWADLYLGGGHRIATDRINGLLMASYGNEWIVEGVNEVVSPVFTSLQFGPKDKALLQQQHIQYLIVDRRLSTGLPRIGVYFEITASGIKQYNKPIDPEALTKFDGMKNVSRLFDSGNINVYDVEAITNPPTITSTSNISCLHASTTAVASTYPHVANFYTGIIHDIRANLTMNISLENIQQQQGAICGSFDVVPEEGLSKGIPWDDSFRGTVNTAKQIQFTVTSKTGQATFSFKGVMQPDGNIAGTYCSLRTATGKCSEYGLWSVSIPEQTRHR